MSTLSLAGTLLYIGLRVRTLPSHFKIPLHATDLDQIRVVLYLHFIIFIYDNIYHIILLWVVVIVQKDQKPKWPSNLINVYSEETRSLSDVTYMVKKSLACSTAGIKTIQSMFSVNYRNTHSVMLLSLTQVNTPVMEKRVEDHADHGTVMHLHWQYLVSFIIYYTVCKNVYDCLISDPRAVSTCSDVKGQAPNSSSQFSVTLHWLFFKLKMISASEVLTIRQCEVYCQPFVKNKILFFFFFIVKQGFTRFLLFYYCFATIDKLHPNKVVMTFLWFNTLCTVALISILFGHCTTDWSEAKFTGNSSTYSKRW